MSQHYSDPKREKETYALPDVEVWEHTKQQCLQNDTHPRPQKCYLDGGDECGGPGYYYWFCFPGCLPDSEPVGPFETEAEALEDARDGVESDDDSEPWETCPTCLGTGKIGPCKNKLEG